MKFRIETEIPDYTPQIRYGEAVLSLGSCFSVEMASRLKRLKYKVIANPAGITFNPISIEHTLKMIKTDDSLPEESVFFNGSVYCNLHFHGCFNHVEKEEHIKKVESSLSKASQFIKNTRFVILTLGTAYVHEHKESGQIVNNCHKLPAGSFIKRRLGVTEIYESLSTSLALIEELSDHKVEALFAVSPVRHSKEGLHANQLSKASCLLAVDQLCVAKAHCHYFPSYEILVDELRDYRYYKEDMVHPSGQAADFIFEKFSSALLAEDEQDIRQQIEKINNAKAHKAFNPDSEQHKLFLEKLKEETEAFCLKYPYIDMG